jgi:hypothetical protein
MPIDVLTVPRRIPFHNSHERRRGDIGDPGRDGKTLGMKIDHEGNDQACCESGDCSD